MSPRPIHVRRRVVAASLGVVAWLLYEYLALHPALADTVAGAGPIPFVRRTLSLVSGIVPFSLAEMVVVAVLAREGIRALRAVRTIRRHEERALRAVGRGALMFAQDLGVLVFFFYMLWGFQYARPDFESYLGIEPSGDVGTEELRGLAERSVEVTNALYREVHGSADAGEPTAAPPIEPLASALEVGWSRVQERYGLPGRVSRSFGRPKPFLASALVKRLGVAGMHFPYTGEALVLGDLPGVLLGKELGHEMAHQRGFARESDANVLGFLVAREAPDPIVRYAAANFLQRQLMSALQRISPDDARQLVHGRLPGVERDIRALDRYWESARTRAAAITSRMNDAMLRSHGISEGVANYAGSTWVFVALARQRGEDALF